MSNLKTHKHILLLALIMMLVFGIILIVDYTSGVFLDHKWGWIGLASMALAAMSQLMVISDIKKAGRQVNKVSI